MAESEQYEICSFPYYLSNGIRYLELAMESLCSASMKARDFSTAESLLEEAYTVLWLRWSISCMLLQEPSPETKEEGQYVKEFD